MGLGSGDVLAIKLAVDVDRGIDLRHDVTGFPGEPPAPHLVAHAGSTLRTSRVCSIMTIGTEKTPAAPRRRYAKYPWIAAALIAGIGLAVYGIAGFQRNGGDAGWRPALETARRVAPPRRGAGAGRGGGRRRARGRARRIAPLARGEVAAINVADDARRVPALSFKDGAGADKTLADWRGRRVPLHLWAHL